MAENHTINLTLSREAAERLFDILGRTETPGQVEDKNALCDLIHGALSAPHGPELQTAKQAAGNTLADATDAFARAQDAYADSLARGGETAQHAASVAMGAGETRMRGAQAVYDAAAQEALEAKVGTVEGQRRAAYARSQNAHDEALVALRAYEPLALEMLKLFRALSFHTDLALADVEAADEARVNPHAAKAADLVRKILQEQKLGHSEAVTKWALAALRELELAAI